MHSLKNRIGMLGLLLIGLITLGCLVSGTFIIVESFTFTAQTGFYFYQVDITDDPDWEDHKDDIDFIDAVGLEFFITSTESGDVTFNAYIDDYSGASSNPTSVSGTATKIINNFTVSPGTTWISYSESLGILTGVERLKTLAKEGQFDYYGESTGNDGNSFVIDSGKVIVTFSASST
jgi:hypothetical protein